MNFCSSVARISPQSLTGLKDVMQAGVSTLSCLCNLTSTAGLCHQCWSSDKCDWGDDWKKSPILSTWA